MVRLSVLLVVLLSIGRVTYAQSIPTISLSDSDKNYNIAKSVGKVIISNDEEEDINFEYIQNAPYTLNDQNILFLSNNTGALLVKILIANNTDFEDWHLEIGSSLAEIEVYESINGNQARKIDLGYHLSFEERFLQTDRLFIPLSIKKGEERVIYLKIKSDYFQAPLHIAPLKHYLERDHKVDLAEGLYYGFVIVMLLYNFFIFLTLRERGYLYYVLYLLTYGLAVSQLRGHGFEFLWGDIPSLNMYAPVLHGTAGIFASLFLMNFLHTEKNAPVFHKTLIAITIGFGLAVVLALFGLKMFASMTNQIVGGISSVHAIAMAAYIYYKGYKPAAYILVAWLFFLIGNILFVLSGAGIIEYNSFTSSAVLFGSAIEMILLSVALAAKIDLYKQERQKVQLQLLKAAEDNAKLVENQNAVLESRVAERTEELNMVNEELSVNLERLNDQNMLIAKKNQDITASINYAKRIQQAMLPRLHRIQELLPDFFVYFEPRDIVSGDFYYFSQTKGKIVVAAVDCTGHGVPGAFMSLIGNDLLNEIVESREIDQADQILNELDKGVTKALRQSDTNIRDGMDISLCVLNLEQNMLEFAGARNPLVYVQNNELLTIKGDRQSVGGNLSNKHKTPFTAHQLQIDKPTTFYLFSDGYQDQFGGDNDRKYTIRRFRQTLLDASNVPMNKQEDFLHTKLKSWKGYQSQIDDVLVLGFRVAPYHS